MIYCEGCGHQIHEMAAACPRCGVPRYPVHHRREKGFGINLACLLLSICLIPACIAAFIAMFTGTRLQCAIWLSLYVLMFLFSAIPTIYNICNKEDGRELNVATLVLLSFHLGPLTLIAHLL